MHSGNHVQFSHVASGERVRYFGSVRERLATRGYQKTIKRSTMYRLPPVVASRQTRQYRIQMHAESFKDRGALRSERSAARSRAPTRNAATFAFLFSLSSLLGHKWQYWHAWPFLQPSAFQNHAHGLQAPVPCSMDPERNGVVAFASSTLTVADRSTLAHRAGAVGNSGEHGAAMKGSAKPVPPNVSS